MKLHVDALRCETERGFFFELVCSAPGEKREILFVTFLMSPTV